MSQLLFTFQDNSGLYLPQDIDLQKVRSDYNHERDRVLKLRAQGMRVAAIVHEVNLSPSRVRQICNKAKRDEGKQEREFNRKMKVERTRIFRKRLKIIISTKIIQAFSEIPSLFALYFQCIKRLRRQAFIDIESLGLPVSDITKLRAAKITSIQSLLIYHADKAHKEIGDRLWNAIADFLDEYCSRDIIAVAV